MAEEENNIDLPGRFAVYGTAGGKPAVVARFEDDWAAVWYNLMRRERHDA